MWPIYCIKPVHLRKKGKPKRIKSKWAIPMTIESKNDWFKPLYGKI